MELLIEGTSNQAPQPLWPYHRCYRPIRGADGYSIEEHNYLICKTFLQLQQELKNLFQYIEPGDDNLKTYSDQIEQLLVRTCIEVESNFKAIFKENIYSGQEKDWCMEDYRKIDRSHRLSDYQVIMPAWDGDKNTFHPFMGWKKSSRLSLYKAYNQVKHNRADLLKAANFANLMNAFCGLFVVLTAQFKAQEYSTKLVLVFADGYNSYYEGNFGIGGMLQVKFPEWMENEKYFYKHDFQNPPKIKFRKFDYVKNE